MPSGRRLPADERATWRSSGSCCGFRLARLRAFLVPVVLAAARGRLYSGCRRSPSRCSSPRPVRATTTSRSSWCSPTSPRRHGLIVATAGWLAVVVLLVLAVCVTAPRQFDPTRRFAVVPRLFGVAEFGAYFSAAHCGRSRPSRCAASRWPDRTRCSSRNAAPVPVLLIAVTVQAVYSFVSTEPLRATAPAATAPRRVPPAARSAAGHARLIALPTSVLSALTGAGCRRNPRRRRLRARRT